jgi:hypothetical protein
MNKRQKKLQQEASRMLELISPLAEYPGKHFKNANSLIVDLADAGMDTTPLMERLYFLTEGWREKDSRSAGERMRAILKGQP